MLVEDAAAVIASVSVTAGTVGLLVEKDCGFVDRGEGEGNEGLCSETGDDSCGRQATTKLRTAMAVRNIMIIGMKLITPSVRLVLTRWSVSKAMHLVHG